MFKGQSIVRLDGTGRITLPPSFRNVFVSTYCHFDGHQPIENTFMGATTYLVTQARLFGAGCLAQFRDVP